MLDIPLWIQIFVVAGIVLIIFVVPIRILWEMTRGARDRKRRVQEFADRLREKFAGVEIKKSVLGPDKIAFKHEDRKLTMQFPEDDEVLLSFDVNIAPKFPLVIKTKGGIEWPVAWEGFRCLGRIRIYDPVLDDYVLIYSTPLFGAYLREAAQAAIPLQGKPKGITESIVILRRVPGVRKFRLTMSESRGFRIWFRLRTQDLVYRPDELEAVIHHAGRLYDALVLY
jgi:hypothetical protein